MPMVSLRDKCVLKCTETEGSGSWVTALPLPYAHLQMSADSYRNALKYRLAIPIRNKEGRCKVCGTIADIYGYKVKINEQNIDVTIMKLKDLSLAVYLRSITRMTISPNVVHGGVKTNIVPDACEAEVDIRVLPNQDFDYVLSELKPLIGDAAIEPLQVHTASFSRMDNEYYRLIESTLKEFVGNNPVLPSVCTGATDSRYMREIGVPSYGTGVITLNCDESLMGSVHGVNEKIDIASLKLKTGFLEKVADKYLA